MALATLLAFAPALSDYVPTINEEVIIKGIR
jgi:hypothetical protein